MAAVRLLLEGLRRADGDLHQEAGDVENALRKLLSAVQAHPPVRIDGAPRVSG